MAAASTDVLVTGFLRSGTTLLEKLLHSHRDVCLASQPFPVLYFYVKSLFLDERGLQRRYPLEDGFLEEGYTRAAFHAFLDRVHLHAGHIEAVFEQLEAYERGVWTPEILRCRQRIVPGAFLDVYRQLNRQVAALLSKADARYVGGKEVLCEEYVPYLLDRGGKAVLIIRDPRDVITSLNFRDRDRAGWTGADRPVLYSLRAWRKSVATALALEEHPGFSWMRYEELTQHVVASLNRVAARLGLAPFSAAMFDRGIYDQHGALWKGNSSFDDNAGVSTDSVGRFATVLPESTVAYVEACCWPEMKRLGYDFSVQRRFSEAAVRRFREPFPVQHDQFPADYSYAPEQADREVARFERLTRSDALDPDDARRWFLYERAYQKLRAAMPDS